MTKQVKQNDKGDNMKLSELVSEVNAEQTAMEKADKLCTAVEKLCEDLTTAMHEKWEHTRGETTHDFSIGKKYIRVYSVENGQPASCWGFINILEFTKGNANLSVGSVKFESGDVLKSAGWKTPAINQPRGNLFDGYDIPPHSMRLYGPDYLR
jgi:hypothetical protein